MPGMRDGYHQDVAAFYDVLVSTIAGKSKSPIDLPPRHDVYLDYNLIGSYASEWDNFALLHLKTLNTCLEDAQIWREHVVHLKELSTRRGGSTFDWAVVIFAVLILILLGYSAHLFYKRWKQTKDYIVLEEYRR